MIQVYDNLISTELVEEMEKFLTSPNLYFTHYTKTTEDDSSDLDKRIKDISKYDATQPVFVSHIIRNERNILPRPAEITRKMLGEIKQKLNINFGEIHRAQVNYTHPTVFSIPSVPHIDTDDIHTVLLYYVTDSDGDTIFYDNDCNVIKTCAPKKGRFVIFDGSILHSSTPPKTHNSRFVININLKEKNEL